VELDTTVVDAPPKAAASAVGVGRIRKDVYDKMKFRPSRSQDSPEPPNSHGKPLPPLQKEPQREKRRWKMKLCRILRFCVTLNPKRENAVKRNPRRRSIEEGGRHKGIPAWMNMWENLDLDKIAHKLMTGGTLDIDKR